MQLTLAIRRAGFGVPSNAKNGVRALQGFVICMPFLHALSLGTWVPVPLAYMGACLLATAVIGRAGKLTFVRKGDLLLLGMVVLGVVGMMLNLGYVGAKNLNHLFAILTTLTIFFCCVRNWMLTSTFEFGDIANAAALATVISSIAVTGEFLSINLYGVYLSDMIPYGPNELPRAEVLGLFLRPRGLAAEPGFSAMVMEALVPLAVVHFAGKRWLLLAYLLLVLPGFILLFSAGAMSAMFMAGAIMLISTVRHPIKMVTMLAVLLGSVLLLTQLSSTAWIVEEIVGRKMLDLFVQGDVTTGAEAGRYEAYRAGIDMFASHPFGIGWGMVSEMFESGLTIPGTPVLRSRGLISLYLEVLVSSGFLGFSLFVVFQWQKVAQLFRVRTRAARGTLYALLSILIHHLFVLEFWFPMLWFLLALSDWHAHRQWVTCKVRDSLMADQPQSLRPPIRS